MDMNSKFPRLCNTRSDFADALRDPDRFMDVMMTESSPYQIPLMLKSVGIEVTFAAALLNWMLASTAVQKTKENQVSGTKTVAGERRPIKSESA